jgi:hypothetical protein
MFCQWLCQQVGLLMLRADCVDFDCTIVNELSEVEVLHIQVLGSWPGFVHRCKFYHSAVVLSSNARQWTMGIAASISKPSTFISVTSSMSGMHSLKAVLKAMYSASVVLKATSVCIFDAQNTGQPAYLMRNPDLLFAVAGSLVAFGSQLPEKLASA